MKVLLVNPYMLKNDPRELRWMQPYAPLGPLYIAAVLSAEGHKIEFTDATFEKQLRPVLDEVNSVKPDLLGVYTTMASRENAMELAAFARSAGMDTVAGGPDATTYPERYLEAGFDNVVVGEGEETIKELMKAIEAGKGFSEVAGLAYRSGDKIKQNPIRSPVKDLDSIPFPKRSIADIQRYRSRWEKKHGYFNLSIMGSRGCPYNCRFCSRPVFGNKYRSRSIENIIAELREIKDKFGPTRVKFADDILPVGKKRTMKLCDAMIAEGLELEFECLSRMTLMDRELLAKMSKAGFRKIYYGVESGSQNVLDAMCKNQSVEQVRAAGMLTKTNGIQQHWYLMLGYPGEKFSDIEDTLNLITDVKPEEFSTTIAQPIRGTGFYDDIYGEGGAPEWKQRAGSQHAFKNRYSKLFYKWSILRMHLAHSMKTGAEGRPTGLARLNTTITRNISRLLAAGK
jgi:radical SAM superfamily enzyme YgiQ (UPF0313 family)